VRPLEFLAIKPCRHDAYEAVPKRKVTLDLDECERVLAGKGYEILSNPKVMLVTRKEVEITLYPHGRLLMQPVKERDLAVRIAQELFSALGM
jgi:ArsR family metal-binding transcriptional regulator